MLPGTGAARFPLAFFDWIGASFGLDAPANPSILRIRGISATHGKPGWTDFWRSFAAIDMDATRAEKPNAKSASHPSVLHVPSTRP